MNEHEQIEAELSIQSEQIDAAPQRAIADAAISPGLARRLIAATSKVQALVLDGEDSFHHYRYPTIAQVRGNANQVLSDAGIAIVPRVARTGRAQRINKDGKTINITVISLDLVVCSEDGEYHASWTGESEDTSDKGVQKAISAGMKSFLAHLLLMPVAEDENDGGRKRSRKRGARPSRAPAPSPRDAEYFAQSPPPAAQPAIHWIDSDTIRKRFWAWAGGELGLSESDVHAALGVQEIHKYAGTMGEAKNAIEAWVKERGAARSPEAGAGAVGGG